MVPAFKPPCPLVFPRTRAVLAGCVLGWAAACGQGDAAAPETTGPPEVAVEVVTLAPEVLRDEVAFVGQLEAAGSVMVRAETEGVIEAIRFEEGAAVEEGQILFELRNGEQEARLRLAEADLAKVAAEYRRTKRLADRNAASAAALERQAAERQIARAAVDLARVQLEKTFVRAPFAGHTGEHKVYVGDRVDETRNLVRLDDISRVQLFFSLPEQALPLARSGVPLEISVAPYPGETFPGEVFFVAPYLEAETRRLSVKAWVPNPDGRLRPGLFAEVKAVLDTREDALVVPEASVVYDREGPFVWGVDDAGDARRVSVDLGLRVGGRVEVVSGLAPGDRIVAAGTNKVFEGSRVRDVASQTADRAAADGGGT